MTQNENKISKRKADKQTKTTEIGTESKTIHDLRLFNQKNMMKSENTTLYDILVAFII